MASVLTAHELRKLREDIAAISDVLVTNEAGEQLYVTAAFKSNMFRLLYAYEDLAAAALGHYVDAAKLGSSLWPNRLFDAANEQKGSV